MVSQQQQYYEGSLYASDEDLLLELSEEDEFSQEFTELYPLWTRRRICYSKYGNRTILHGIPEEEHFEICCELMELCRESDVRSYDDFQMISMKGNYVQRIKDQQYEWLKNN